ncbi:hypothetical protein TNCV_2139701 [Trichonephila clavipes]|uniref:Uncharacterized protein n=1 Tax=Trichonephila clavipes TaxID=2585209 RepID=A0A8X6S4W8_TRICX|nr:hypothetical protein TNCV_2139701 [Trichonephila clavipes]
MELPGLLYAANVRPAQIIKSLLPYWSISRTLEDRRKVNFDVITSLGAFCWRVNLNDAFQKVKHCYNQILEMATDDIVANVNECMLKYAECSEKGKILEQNTAVFGDKSFSPSGVRDNPRFSKWRQRRKQEEKRGFLKWST